ncbi:MAG: DinB family protein [Acidobacteria bacterium]|nr:DinB family protein [Acidobacteriota bacterium]
MKNRIAAGITALVFLAVAGTVAYSQAQKAPAKAPAAAKSASTEALDNWNRIGKKLIEMAEDFPEAKYNYKPTPEVRSFGEVLLHAASSHYGFTNSAAGKVLFNADDDPKPGTFKNKAEIVAFVKKSVEDGVAEMKEKGEAGMAKEAKHPWSNRMARLTSISNDVVMHSCEHYGNLVVYYRLNKLVPPESRPKK